ncbi:glycosyl hydrolase 53 family protein [Gynuella sp.]|uniref:glycosyl hydrolase 53 family protein n=1 Tax=Gynuella sp. TaxID=2969146 RepID=UPI003D13BCDB
MLYRHALWPLLTTLILVGCNSSEDIPLTESPRPLNIYVQPIQNISDDFIKGVDISTLLEVEKGNGQFYDETGKPVELLAFLAQKGVNWVRLRLWNDPYYVSWQETHSEWVDGDNNPYYPINPVDGSVGAGTNDLNATIALAQRAKQAGMKVLLDFHYSDFWADPGKQYSPEAWKNLGNDDAAQALYQFTYDSLTKLADAGLFPDMVQVGNEINNGLMWDNNGKWNKYKDSDDSTYDVGMGYLKQGIAAIHAAEQYASADTRIMLHLAEGGDKEVFDRVFGAFTRAGLDYDIIGASYYPYWHGSLEALQENLDAVSAKYHKPVVVAETAYGFTTEYSPDGGDVFNASSADAGGFLATVQGQATAIREVMNVVAQVPEHKGLGVFYWEPAWLTNKDIDHDGILDGAGWIYNQPSSWDNQAMFDYDGKALDSLDVFWAVNRDPQSTPAPTVTGIPQPSFERRVGDELALPEQIKALYNDDAYRQTTVSWDNPEAYNTDQAGVFALTGTVGSQVVTAQLIVIANVLENGDFETGTATPWELSNDSAFSITGDNPHNGSSYALHFWSNDAMNDSAVQTITGIPNGHYQVSVWTMGASNGDSSSSLSASSGNNRGKASVSFTGFGNWNQSFACVAVENNELTVTVQLTEAGGSWGEFDDIKATAVANCS